MHVGVCAYVCVRYNAKRQDDDDDEEREMNVGSVLACRKRPNLV